MAKFYLQWSFVTILVLVSPTLFIVDAEDRDIDVSLINYQLYTRRNPNDWQTLKLNDLPSLERSFFNPAVNTKIYAIGWDNDGSIANSTKDEYLVQENCNFIVLDWKAVQIGNNARVLNVTLETGYHMAQFIEYLMENTGVPMASFHLIGHSAGAHAAGAAGSTFTRDRIPRITGLEPANGIFSPDRPDISLDVTDTLFLDVVHTNGGDIADGNFGIYEPLGHVDFYVNGAVKQPGCDGVGPYSCCSHCRAADLFAESITTQIGFIGLRCDSYENYVNGSCNGNDVELMGEHVSLESRGIFYLDTNAEAPWACGLCA